MTVKGYTTNKLIDAIHAGSLSGVLNALDAGDDIEMPDMHGYGGLPLRTACFEGNLAIVRELLNRGANPNTTTCDGPGAPLRLALRKGHQDIADLLRQKGAMPLDGMVPPPVILDAPSVDLPGDPVTLPETKPDNIIEFSPSGPPPLTDETVVPPLHEYKPGNLIEFSSSDLPLSADEAEAPSNFGTATGLLSMDLLFLEEDELPDPPPPAPDKR